KNKDLPWNWPIIGMLPMILTNWHRLADRCTEILESSGGTFTLKGFWFVNMDLIITSDPANVHHILSSNFSIFATGCDACSSFPVSFHENIFPNAIANACEAIFARHIFPESIWKLQKWLGIGKEGKLRDAWITIDNVLAEQISLKRKEMSDRMAEEDIDFNALELHLIGHRLLGPLSVSNSLIRDNMLALMFGTQDTTSTALGSSGFFQGIRLLRTEFKKKYKNIFPKMEKRNGWPMTRTPLQNDTLPSGYRVNQGQNILICTYAMGRMTSVWGEDCREFKPERWITHDGGIKHEPAHKFFAFNAGPRICPGKDLGFTLMKAIASTIIHNYHVQVVENHVVTPKSSIILHMKHGLMVTVKKRWP
ncbi:hypothetical protein QUC31_001201, partial [Theobroma cacao]